MFLSSGAKIWFPPVETEDSKHWLKQDDGRWPFASCNHRLLLITFYLLSWSFFWGCVFHYLSPTQRSELAASATTSPRPLVPWHVKANRPSVSGISWTASSMAGDSRDSSWLRLPMVEFFLRIFSFGKKKQQRRRTASVVGLLGSYFSLATIQKYPKSSMFYLNCVVSTNTKGKWMKSVGLVMIAVK